MRGRTHVLDLGMLGVPASGPVTVVERGMPPPAKVLGREAELLKVQRWVAANAPICEVIGERGIGKSLLSAECVRSWQESRHTLWHSVAVDDSAQDLEEAIAEFLGKLGWRRPRGSPGARALAGGLRQRRAILILDGVDQGSPAAGLWISRLLEAAASAEAKVLITSRTPISVGPDFRVRGLVETVRLGGLPLEAAQALAGPEIPGPALMRLHVLSRGNPLALRLAVDAYTNAPTNGYSESERVLLGYLKSTREDA
jgi:hypothetical protein